MSMNSGAVRASGLKQLARLSAALLVLVVAVAGSAAQGPEVSRGLSWLSGQVQADGSLTGEAGSVARPVQAATDALHTLAVLDNAAQPLVLRVAANGDVSTESLARSAIALTHARQSPTSFIVALLKRRNADGGFGDEQGSASNPLDTAWALLAFRVTGFNDAPTLKAALDYLVLKNRGDGGYAVPGESSSVLATSYALQALVAYRDAYALDASIGKSVGWLQGARSGGGSYGSTLYDALAAIALSGATTDATQYAPLLAALRTAQAADGSWSADPYLTSLALRALSGQGQPPPAVAQGRVAGRVIDASSRRPLPDSSIAVAGFDLRTNAEGRFETAGIDPGAYPLSVTRTGYLAAQRQVTVAAAVVNNLGDIELALPSGGALLQGAVFDGSSGQPLQGASVQIDSAGALLSAVTGAGGVFEIGGIPASLITVTVQKAGYRSVVASMQVSGGASYGFSPALYADSAEIPATAVLKGRIVDDGSGQGIPGAQVAAGGKLALSSTDGRFEIAGLDPGSVQLSVAAEGYHSASFKSLLAKGDNQSGDLALKSAALSMTVFGKVIRYGSATGIPGAVVRVQGTSRQAVTDSQGDYRIDGLNEKHLTLIVSSAGHYTQTYPVNVAEFGSYRFNLQLTRAEDKGLRLAAASNLPSYPPYNDVQITVTANNTQSQKRKVVFSAQVYDSEHRMVDAFPFRLLSLGESAVDIAETLPANGGLDLGAKWHTQESHPGEYSIVVSGATPEGEMLAQASVGIRIEARLSIGGGFTLDPPITQAGTSQPVSISALVGNSGNLDYAGGPARLSVVLERPDPYAPQGVANVQTIAASTLLNTARGAVMDAEGNLYTVTTTSTARKVIKVKPDGGVAELTNVSATLLRDITRMPDGSLRVLGTDGRIYPVSLNGTVGQPLQFMPAPANGQALDADSQGNIFVVGTTGGSRVLTRISGGQPTELLRGALSNSKGLAPGPDGSLYASNFDDNNISRIDSAGRVEPFVTSGLNRPTGVLSTSDGGLLVADSGSNRILKVAADKTIAVFASGVPSAQGMAYHPSGDILVSTSTAGLLRFSPSGQKSFFAQSFGSMPSAVAYDASGRLHAAGQDGALRRLNADGSIDTLLASGLSAAQKLAFGRDGALYSVSGSNSVVRYVPGAAQATSYATGLSGAAGLAQDASGNWLIAESSANRITRIGSGGVKETLAQPLMSQLRGIVATSDGTRYLLSDSMLSRLPAGGKASVLVAGFSGIASDIALNPAGGVYVLMDTRLMTVSDDGVMTQRATVPSSQRLAVDADGSVYLSSSMGGNIYRLAPDNIQTTFSSLPAVVGDLDVHPDGGLVAALPDGYLYRIAADGTFTRGASAVGIANALSVSANGDSYLLLDSGQFLRLSAEGQATTLLSGLSATAGFARFASGDYDILDESVSMLRRYDAANQLRDTVAGFSAPADVEWMDGEIVFADSSRVYRMSPEEGVPRVMANLQLQQLRYWGGVLYGQIRSTGRLVRIGTDGSVADVYAGSMQGSQHAFAVKNGEFGLSSRANHRVLVVDAGGAVQAVYLGLTSPTGIAVDASGRVWVAASNGVMRYSADGRSAEVLPVSFAKSLALAPDGTMWAGGIGQVFRYGSGGFVSAGSVGGTDTVTQISALAFQQGQLYAADLTSLRRLSGTSLPLFAAGIEDVVAMKVAPDGAIYMVSSKGSIQRYVSGALQIVSTGAASPRSLLFRNGELYVGALSELYKVDLASGEALAQGIAPVIASKDLQGLALDPQGRILAIGFSGAAVYRVEPATVMLPPPAGTEVHSLQASLAPMAVGSTKQELDLGSWIPPYAGEYSLRLLPADNAAGGSAVGTLYAGPHARGAMTTDRAAVLPGSAQVGVRIGVQGAGTETITQVNVAGLQLVQGSVSPTPIGTGPLGETYFLQTGRIMRLKADGTRETFFAPGAHILNTKGILPVDPQGNLYVSNNHNQLLRIRSDGTAEVVATLPASITEVVLDSRGNAIVTQLNQSILYRVNTATGSLTPIQPGVPRVVSLSIDSQDNLYVQQSAGGTVAKIRPDGAVSIVLDSDIGFEQSGESGPRLANDCADNLLVAPSYWPAMGQSSTSTFEEEHTLVQIEKTGRTTKLMDGLVTSPKITDLDFIAYDRYGQRLLMWTDIKNEITRMPIRCGYISTDLHVVVPAGQGLSGFDPPPSTIAGRPDGSQEYVWKLQDIAASPERQVRYDTLLTGLQLGDERPVATEAFLLFQNSFAEGSVKLPLAVPKVMAGAGTLSMTLTTGEASYPAQTAVDVVLALEASGPSVRGRLKLDLLDAGGALVHALIDENHSVAAGAPVLLNPPLDTGSYSAGAYQLKATFVDEAGLLQAKADAAFSIAASGEGPGGQPAVSVSAAADKPVYGEYEAVQIRVRARSQASNVSYENLTLRLTALDPQGSPVYSSSRVIAQLQPATMAELSGSYQLPGGRLGSYSLLAEALRSDGSVLASGTSAFEVRKDDAAKLSGSVAVGTRSPYLGDAQSCRDTIVNGGVRALSALPVRQRVIELGGSRVVSEELAQVSVAAGGSQVLNRSFSTAGYKLSGHACVLEAQVEGQWKTLGYDSFDVQDAAVQLSGSVVASVKPIPMGETQTCRDTVRNAGLRSAAGIPVRRSVVQMSPERRLREETGSISLPAGSEQTDIRVFSTEGFEQGPHACVLEASLNGQWQVLGYDNFTVDPPPVRVTATIERGGRGRVLVLMDGAKVNGSSKSEPEPAQQRQFLETLLSREGWSYTIVTDPEAFTWELRSGGYNVYALFSESAKLSERVQTELREAAYRGEGLLEAGAHDQRHHNFDDALGVKYQGKASQVTGVEVLATEPGPTGYADLALRDKPLKAQLNAASSLGRYLGNKGSDPSAVTTRRYGRGRSVYMGYDLLAEATLAGSNSLHAQLLLRSLAYIQPDYGQIAAGRVIPLRIRLENEAKPAAGQLTLPMPNGATVVDAGTATANNGVLTWAVDLAQDEDETYTAWVRLPDAGGAVSFVAQLKIGGSVHTTATLALSPVATGGLVEARALAGPISAFKQVANWLDKADVALRAGDAETALSHLAKASDELMKVQHASAGDLRLMIDQALLDAGRRLWNG